MRNESGADSGGRPRRLVFLAGILASALVCFWSLAVAVGNASRDYPLEYRENAVFFTTVLMLEGRNPYAVEELPLHLNTYGPGYSWMVYPFAALAGPSFAVHRFVSVAFIVLCGVVLYWAVRQSDGTGSVAFAAAAVLLGNLGLGLSTAVRPDSFGLFLFLLSMTIPVWRRFSLASLAACGALSALGLYTKQYFIIGAPYVLAYVFLFVSKRRAVLGGLISAGILVASLLLMRAGYPCYFTACFSLMSAASSRLDVHHLVRHGGRFLLLHAVSVLVVGAMTLDGLRAMAGSRWKWRVAIRDLPAPLVHTPCMSLPSFGLLCGFVIMLWLGLKPGQGILYYQQLILPFLLWSGFTWLSRQTGRGIAFFGAVAVVLQVAIVGAYVAQKAPRLLRDHSAAWQAVASALAEPGHVLHDAAVAHIIRDQGKTVWDTGHSEAICYGTPAGTDPVTREFVARAGHFRQRIAGGLSEVTFDTVATSGYSLLIDRRALAENYEKVGVLPMPLILNSPRSCLKLWRPRQRRENVNAARFGEGGR